MSRTADQDLRRLWAIGNTLKNRVFAGKSLWDHLLDHNDVGRSILVL